LGYNGAAVKTKRRVVGLEKCVGQPFVKIAASKMIDVSKIKYLGGYRVRATFNDGMAGEYDFSSIIAEGGPMAEPLRDPAYFARVFLEDGAPAWPNGFDAAPGWLRREIEAADALVREVGARTTRDRYS
jgi:hypothetical protein